MKTKLLILFIPFALFAQPDRDDHTRKAMGIWQLTEKLDLTEKEAEKFFPKFNAHQKEMDQLRRAHRMSLKDLHEALQNDKEVSQATLDKAIKDLEEIEGKKIQARIDFLNDLDGVLTTTQRAKLMLVPGKMRNEAKEKIKKHKKQKRRRHNRDKW